MAELLLIFRTNEQFCPFQHRLYHYRPGIRDLHHPVKFQCQVLLAFNIQHHSADIRFMHRTDNLSHYGESTSAGEGYDLFLIIRNKFVYQRDTCRMEQCLYIMRLDISVFRNRINNTTNPRDIHSKQFYFRNSRFRSINDTRKGRPECYFIGKVHVPFSKKRCNFSSGSIDRRKNRENRFLASLHLFVKHIIHFKHSNQSRSSEDSHHGIYVFKLFFTVINAETQMLWCPGSQNIYRISNGSTGKKLSFQFFRQFAFELRYVQTAFTQRICQHYPRSSGMSDNGKILSFQFG